MGLAFGQSVWADATHVVVSGDVQYESNLGRARKQRDILDDQSLVVGARVARSMRINANSGLALSAQATVHQQAQYTDLSHLDVGVMARYRNQPVVGYTEPWVELSASATRLQFADSDIRDGWQAEIGLGLGKNFTDKLSSKLHLLVDARRADDARVFDLDQQMLRWSLDYKPSEVWTVYGHLGRVWGEQTAVSSRPLGEVFQRKPYLKALDTALSTQATQRNVYRLDAISNVAELGVNYRFTERASLDASVSGFRSKADIGTDYSGLNARLGVLLRF